MLSRRIRKVRRLLGFSQQALANELGVSRGAVSNWESSSNIRPSIETLMKIAGLAKVRFEWLATGQGATEDASLSAMESPSVTNVVTCPGELELLHSYRSAPDRVKRVLWELLRMRGGVSHRMRSF